MEEKTTTKNRGRRSAGKAAAESVPATAGVTQDPAQGQAPIPEEKTAADTASVQGNKHMVPKDVDVHQYVTVRNGFQGELIYKSRRTGEKFVWDSFGAEQDMELGELKQARSSNKKYFINNWFMFDEPWIVDYLGLWQYYKFAVSIKDFDTIFDMTPEEIENTLSNMSAGQKKSVAYRARQLIAEEKIDSHKVVSTLEKCLGVELVER